MYHSFLIHSSADGNLGCFRRALDLSETGIAEIPPPVFKLKTLRWLWLARNPIKAVSDEIREISSLSYLNLDGTQVDRIPSGLTGLGSFRYLRMNDTPLDDGIFTDSAGAIRSRSSKPYASLSLNGCMQGTPRSRCCRKRVRSAS